ncbi:MAG: hypothetical protein IOB85_05045 [Methylobacterium sp.]|nr:hypothetical protein [Rhodobacter sp.]MCA3649758.1 hypothetical protein [Methylobacterium sp.]MCA3654071.1 hypothetical protein [Methylobacterium sp.]MCA3657183.1 hypothetical protein [Methylobacterium sp.]MCA3663965.1 hypothetical protein [Methylobacterium sp.]
MKIKLLLTVFLAGLMAFPAIAQQIPQAGDIRCDDNDYRIGWLEKILRSFDGVVSPIEKPPPSELEWFERELNALLKHQSAPRWQIVASHRFYHPWQVHKSHINTRQYIDLSLQRKTKKDHLKLLIAFISSYSEFVSEIHPYMSIDEKREQPILSTNDRSNINFELIRIRMLSQSLADCIVDRMKE